METKSCSKCKEDKPLHDFHKDSCNPTGRMSSCKKCRNGKHNYRRTIKGKVVSVYSDMLGRVTGRTNDPNYIGLPICTKEEFYEFSLSCPIYKKLHDDWRESDWFNDIKPSIDRIIPSKGYILSNIRWVTFLDNISKNINVEDYKFVDVPF